jgi:glyoxylase-like metal-dependent hydrolase (beta-lactamase superfamily II)
MSASATTPHDLDLGGPRLFWLDGGGFRLDGGTMFGAVPRPRWSAVCPPADDNSVPLTAHVVLVADRSTWGLLDSGFGHHLSERQRRVYALERESNLEQGLAVLGVSQSRIDWVVLSHLHLDHAGGVLAEDGTPVFPNARIWVQSLEAREARDGVDRRHGGYTGVSFDRLESLGLIHEVDGDADVTAHVGVTLTGGHTRGHQATLVRGSEGAAFLHLGDLLVTRHHLPPAWISALDDFPLDTRRAKREWLTRAAISNWWVGFSHDPTAVAARLTPDARHTSKLRTP